MANNDWLLEEPSPEELAAEQALLRQQHNTTPFQAEFEKKYKTLTEAEIVKLQKDLRLVTLRKVKKQSDDGTPLVVLEFPSGGYVPGSDSYKAIFTVRVYFELFGIEKYKFNSARVADTTGLLDTKTLKVKVDVYDAAKVSFLIERLGLSSDEIFGEQEFDLEHFSIIGES